jgi:hypothetical protein
MFQTPRSRLDPSGRCIASEDSALEVVFPAATSASSLLGVVRLLHGSQIAGLQPCKFGIVSHSGNSWLPACPPFPAAPLGPKGEASRMRAPRAPKPGTAYDIGPRLAIRDCTREGHLAEVACGAQTAYDRTRNES